MTQITNIQTTGDGTIKEKTIIVLGKGISSNKFQVLQFYGLANGTNLTRNYNLTLLQQNFLRIISIDIDYYADNSNWFREAAYDNTVFTTNVNARYSMLRPYSKLDPSFLQELVDTGQNITLINENVPLSIFPSTRQPAFNHFEMNLLTDKLVSIGIDFNATFKFYNNVEAPTELFPFIVVTIPVEIIPQSQNKEARTYGGNE